MSDPIHILIVEDDAAIAAGVAMNLRIEGYQPLLASDGEDAVPILREAQVDLLLLDISLPRKNGLDLLRELRQAGDETPVIVLSARQEEYDKVAALRLGADDYVTKPFALAELMARVQAVLRRVSARAGAARRPEAGEEGKIVFGAVELSRDTRTVLRGGEPVRLTHLEFELLLFLVSHPARVFTREELYRHVWGQSSGSKRTVDNFVLQLRSKLEDDPDAPRHFVTVRGSGYRFDP